MDSIHLSSDLHNDYRRFLETSFYFRDEQLRSSFSKALSSGDLVNGPYIEATPTYKQGLTARALFSEILGARPDDGFLNAIHGNRPLYKHQEDAVRTIAAGRNVLVATGTGSGKTESYLLPILLSLYQEHLLGTLGQGIRALILYPMNALVNDQRDRLGKICESLDKSNSPFRFTFGQYVGQTPENERDSSRDAQDHLRHRLPGELVLRSEIRERLPHIILTNFSMLEYLLLRPTDSPLFDGEAAVNWKFMVLDEAHQYSGTKGLEVGMLLRRLKRRLHESGRTGPIRCMATSATLFRDETDAPRVAEFASNLFGESFTREGIICGDCVPPPERDEVSLSIDEYEVLSGESSTEAVRSDATDEILRRHGAVIPSSDRPKSIGSILSRDCKRGQLLRALSTGPKLVTDLVADVFSELPHEEGIRALDLVLSALTRYQDPYTATPLISARFHLFVRSLEGAYLSLCPKPEVLLARKPDGDGPLFELALCHECGQHYLVGRHAGGKFAEAIRDPGSEDFSVSFYLPMQELDLDENADETGLFLLCGRCGQIGPYSPNHKGLQCGHDNLLYVRQQKSPEGGDGDGVAKCATCGYRSFDPVRELVYGSHAPTAVLATRMHLSMPENGRKLLTFSDGRQDAAFFAWYLEDSQKSIQIRSLMLGVIDSLAQHSSSGLSIGDISSQLSTVLRKGGLTPAAASERELQSQSWRFVYTEFLTEQSRISLEGTGCLNWFIHWPDWLVNLPSTIGKEFTLDDNEVRSILVVLLNSLRVRGAVELLTPPAVNCAWDDLNRSGKQMTARIGPPQNDPTVDSWDGARTVRADFIYRVLRGRGIGEAASRETAVRLLRYIWETIWDLESSVPDGDRLMLSVGSGKRLNPGWWRTKPLRADDPLYECSVCGRLASVSVGGVCPRYRCPGALRTVEVQELTENHYRQRYRQVSMGQMRVEEHTAQLDREYARRFQREFRDGHIHVLSCSTTFELGVDLGDLDKIFLRNVPPQSFNYTQRVGRAGRRSEQVGFALTYCRRSPHDLYFFYHPEEMIKGSIKPPVICLSNPKIIIRHIAAIVLSAFFRRYPARFASIEGFMVDLSACRAVHDVVAFIEEQQGPLEESIKAVLPKELWEHPEFGFTKHTWTSCFTNEQCAFSVAQAELQGDIADLTRVREQAFKDNKDGLVKWAGARRNTLLREDVLSFVSRKAIIPKYGFPVDVVELDVQGLSKDGASASIGLQRDLSIAIAEFAPSNSVIANKREWSSYALKRVPDKEWEQWEYVRCAQHNHFESRKWLGTNDAPAFTACCNSMQKGRFIEPRFGFTTAWNESGKTPTRQPPRLFTTRPYFQGYLDAESDAISYPGLSVHEVRPGNMTVICEGKRGKAFHICSWCGAGFTRAPMGNAHSNPRGGACTGMLKRAALGHRFVTDVLKVEFELDPDLNETDLLGFSHGLAAALTEGAALAIQVPTTDLNGVVAARRPQAGPSIVLYDDVPGGAGLVKRLQRIETLKECLLLARTRAADCTNCDDETSCYACLRNYRNQFVHDKLKRGLVARYLDRVIESLS